MMMRGDDYSRDVLLVHRDAFQTTQDTDCDEHALAIPAINAASLCRRARSLAADDEKLLAHYSPEHRERQIKPN
jgi:hypothetical protein